MFMAISPLKRTIVDAIRGHKVLQIDYHDPRGFRRVEPHACGVNRRGNDVVRVFQVCGPSRSGTRVNYWKMMRIDRIRDLQVLDDRFERPRPDYRPGDAHMVKICAELAPMGGSAENGGSAG